MGVAPRVTDGVCRTTEQRHRKKKNGKARDSPGANQESTPARILREEKNDAKRADSNVSVEERSKRPGGAGKRQNDSRYGSDCGHDPTQTRRWRRAAEPKQNRHQQHSKDESSRDMGQHEGEVRNRCGRERVKISRAKSQQREKDCSRFHLNPRFALPGLHSHPLIEVEAPSSRLLAQHRRRLRERVLPPTVARRSAPQSANPRATHRSARRPQDFQAD